MHFYYVCMCIIPLFCFNIPAELFCSLFVVALFPPKATIAPHVAHEKDLFLNVPSCAHRLLFCVLLCAKIFQEGFSLLSLRIWVSLGQELLLLWSSKGL